MKHLLFASSLALSPLLALSLTGCTLDLGDADSAASTSKDLSPSTGGPLPETCGSPELHVIGIYETYGHQGCTQPGGDAHVIIERPGNHVLVLSAYAQTDWHVTLAPGATVQAITLIGYEAQTVDLPGVPVTHDFGCGYSYPYNGGGCDTNVLLQLAESHAGAPLTSFHGCYQAGKWLLHPDGSVDSDCNTAAGYQVDELYGTCDGGGVGDGWQQRDFPTIAPPTCAGARYVRHDDRYGVWVGAIQCGSSNSYKLYMAQNANEPFLEIADYAGHGQDHCELVNPDFTLPNEDDITSGGCTTCSVGPVVDPIGVPVFARSYFGQPFQRVISTFGVELSTTMYSCGVAIPQR